MAKSAIGPAILLLAAAAAVLPQRHYGYSCGHDFDFHLVSWIDALASWREGVFYPQWAASPNYGAGEPRFLFYPPLTWMLGAGLKLVRGWGNTPVDLAFLILAASGLATRALAREFLEDSAATLAGCAAIFCGYTLFTAYERSAFGELTGGFWFPLLLLLLLRDRNSAARPWRRALDGSATPLALVIAGAWLSNVPVGVMANYLLAAVAVGLAMLRKSWAPVIRSAIGGLLGMALAATFLVPATWEQRWVDVHQAIDDPGTRIETSWIFARHADPALEAHDIELLKVSVIGASMLGVAFAGILIGWLRRRRVSRREWWVLAAIPAVILFLQIPISLPVWNLLPKLRFLQFPWRWYVVLEAPMAVLFAAAVWPVRRWQRIAVAAVCMMVFAVATAVAGKVFYQDCFPEDSISAMLRVYAAGQGFEGTDEYSPSSADNSLVPTSLPAACLVTDPAAKLGISSPDTNPEWEADQHSCDATFSAASRTAEHLRIAATTVHAGYLILRLRSYPAWRVRVNGQPATTLTQREDGLMAVPVPRGQVNLAVDWTATADVIAGRWVSGIALLLLTGLGASELRRRGADQPRLS
jgi:hypothetical protein